MTRNLKSIFRFTGVLLFLVLLSIQTGSSVWGQGSTPVFINELHYDNASTDAGEAIEIAGPSGTDLSGWSIVLYNGSGGAPYTTTSLSGILPDQQNGFGTLSVSYPENGIQNGAPDGLALVDASNVVVQFLSYEGAFTAVGGPADGMTSVDIGVSESSSTLVGESLQLTGDGSVYEDFTWADPSASTFGDINTNQTFSGTPTDTDGDGVPDSSDNCPNDANPGQEDDDEDGIGNACDSFTSVPIYDIQYTTDASGDSPYIDQADVPVEGIVTGRFEYGYFIQAPTSSPWNGLWVHDTDNTPALGDWVLLTGTVLEYFNLTELDALTFFEVASSGNPLPAPVVLSTAAANDEQYEGMLVQVENVNVSNPDLGFGEWEVNDGSGPLIVDEIGAYAYSPVQDDPINTITGPLNFSYGAYKIAPRDDGDIDAPLPPSALVINEILADPDATNGDANGDGTVNTTDDEFVEIVNNSDSDIDISGWTLSDGYGVRHTFPAGTIVSANCTIVIFGGGNPSGSFGGAIVQTANGAYNELGLNNSGDTITLNDGATDQTVVSYGGEGGDNQSLTRDPDISGSFVKHSVATNSGGALFSPGTMIDGSLFPGCSTPLGACGDPATLIHDVQGSGATSPLVGTSVIIEGVVVGDFQNNGEPDNGDLNAFYLQEEDGEVDVNPETSEGILVYAPTSADVQVGNHVRVAGEVQEYSTSSGASLMTELGNVSDLLVCDTPAPMPSPTVVTLPVSNITDFERYEGMLVTFTQDLVISEYFNFDRYGEIVLAWPPEGQNRLQQPTAIYEPGSTEAAELAALNALSRITLDDGRGTQNPDPAIHPNGNIFDLTNTFRGGDIVQGATGVVDETFGLYRIQPTVGANYVSANPRTDAPKAVGGTLKVSSFNVLNYFLTLDNGTDDICGPLQDQECRGADDAEEFQRQRAKILSALSVIDADIFGLIEMENTTGVEPLQDIVDGLNDQLGAGTYAFINTGTIGGDAIKVGLIYKPATVTPLGNFEILDSTDDPRFDDTKSRPVLAQTFQENATGGIFTVALNHLKSKGSACGEGDDDPEQGSCNVTRTLAAQALVDWLATDPTDSGDPDFLIMGDLNSYDKEDPIDAILAGADDILGNGDDYTDLIAKYQGEYAYSYVFDGQVGYLDHGLVNASLTPQVTGVTEWHINSDEPDILDYDTSFKQDAQDALYEPNAFRASDHDPVIIGLDMVPRCNDEGATIYVGDNGIVYGGPYDGKRYKGFLIGTKRDDVIVGTDDAADAAGSDKIKGRKGNHIVHITGRDKIMGREGNDVICGLGGWDMISGHKGNDVLLGGAGNDKLKGDQGDDILDGGDGRDLCHGGSGTDKAEACEFTIRIP